MENLVGVGSLIFTLVLLPALIIPVTRLAAQGKLPRNGGVGIRTRYTKASDAAWVAGHAAARSRVAALVPVAALTVVVTVGAAVVGGGGWAVAAGLAGVLAETAVVLSVMGRVNAAARGAPGGVEGDREHRGRGGHDLR